MASSAPEKLKRSKWRIVSVCAPSGVAVAQQPWLFSRYVSRIVAVVVTVIVCALNVHSSVVASQVIVMHSCCDDDAVVTSCLHNRSICNAADCIITQFTTVQYSCLPQTQLFVVWMSHQTHDFYAFYAVSFFCSFDIFCSDSFCLM